jgi:ADP-ribose pyrophosphatase YjhB (NUDIX family)
MSSRPNRLRLRGSRIEVIVALLTRKPTRSILLARAAAYGIWTLPQEGVGLRETYEEALYRCLAVECGLDRPPSREQLERRFYLRSFQYVGVLDLPEHRWGERLIADDAIGTALESIRLRRKAYWVGSVLVPSQESVTPMPDGNEVDRLEWCPVEQADQRLHIANRPEKAELLTRALQAAIRHL